MPSFPINPPNGTIFETQPGVFYVYSAGQNTWVKQNNYGQNTDLATGRSDGLMNKEDYNKLRGLMLPPPKTTISVEDCDVKFGSKSAEIFGFRSSEFDIKIEYELSVYDRDKFDIPQEEKRLFRIHENTYGINFAVDIDQLIKKMNDLGNITYNKKVGAQGVRGVRGPHGRDRLNTGPVGLAGKDGINAVWDILIIEDTTPQSLEVNRGIVDIGVEEISKDENYLVVTRANIGSLQYCPEFIKPKKGTSQWVLVVDERQQFTKKLLCDTSLQCGFEVCGNNITTIPYCTTRLYYIDVSDIEAEIKSRFEELLANMKAAKEQFARDWLAKMMSLFQEQKVAICCAKENIASRQENRRIRNEIENKRIALAQAGLQLVLGPGGGNEEFREFKNLNTGRDCEFPIPTPSHPDFTDITSIPEPPPDAIAAVNVDCAVNNRVQNAVSIILPAGTYDVEVSQCCFLDLSNLTYKGVVFIQYNSPNGVATISIPDFGAFTESDTAKVNFIGSRVAFVHTGGEIKVFSNIDNCTGVVQAIFTEAYTHVLPATAITDTDVCPPAPVIPPGDPDVDSESFNCDINLEQVLWYEVGWRTGACCGAYLSAGGVGWIIVKRSLGSDTTCGGGETINTPCIGNAIQQGFHPALAFQSLDGIEFIGKPTSVQRMFRDLDLETEIMAKIRNGDVYKTIGNPFANFDGILFPFNLSSGS